MKWLAAALLYLPVTALAAENTELGRFVEWISGRWDNQAQILEEQAAQLPEAQRHQRYPMDYIAVETRIKDGVVFAIHNYGDAGFEGELRRISLHRFSWSGSTREVVHQFLFVNDKETFGPRPGELALLADLDWEDIRTNAGCTMYWHWRGDHYEGATRPGECVTSSFTPEPIRIEARGELWPDRLVRHDVNMTLEGTVIPRDGGETPEVFLKAD